MSKKKIYLRAGHQDSLGGGAEGCNGIEHEFNLTLALGVEKYLKMAGGSFEIRQFRTTNDTNASVGPAAVCQNIYNEWAPDAFVSIHNNASGGHYGLVLYPQSKNDSKNLASKVSDRLLVARKEIKNSPDVSVQCNPHDGSGVSELDDTDNPNPVTILCEVAFIDSEDEGIYFTAQAIDTQAKAIAYGIMDYFNISAMKFEGDFLTCVNGVIICSDPNNNGLTASEYSNKYFEGTDPIPYHYVVGYETDSALNAESEYFDETGYEDLVGYVYDYKASEAILVDYSNGLDRDDEGNPIGSYVTDINKANPPYEGSKLVTFENASGGCDNVIDNIFSGHPEYTAVLINLCDISFRTDAGEFIAGGEAAKDASLVNDIEAMEMFKVQESKAIWLCASILKSNSLTTNNLWRQIDVDGSSGPAPYLKYSDWEKFVAAVKLAMGLSSYEELVANPSYQTIITDPATLKNISEIELDSELLKNYVSTNSSEISPNDRGIADLMTNSSDVGSITQGYMSSGIDAFGNFINASGTTTKNKASHCITDTRTDNYSIIARPVFVDPIYPDMAAPPGSSSAVFNSEDGSMSYNWHESGLPSVEAYKTLQSSFNPKKHVDEIKLARGQVINNNDPYPADTKITELEKHDPRVGISDASFTIDECQHPGCNLGASTANTFAALYDAVIELSNRTESRIVMLENNLSTMIRNYHRLAARVIINCTWYGGQDVFGKYKCIRCMHPDRVNDGQIMTMEQCCNCQRYDPIYGQTYDIMDDSGVNLAHILDQNVLSYTPMSEHINNTRIEEFSSAPTPFSFKNTIEINRMLEANDSEKMQALMDSLILEKATLESSILTASDEEKSKYQTQLDNINSRLSVVQDQYKLINPDYTDVQSILQEHYGLESDANDPVLGEDIVVRDGNVSEAIQTQNASKS